MAQDCPVRCRSSYGYRDRGAFNSVFGLHKLESWNSTLVLIGRMLSSTAFGAIHNHSGCFGCLLDCPFILLPFHRSKVGRSRNSSRYFFNSCGLFYSSDYSWMIPNKNAKKGRTSRSIQLRVTLLPEFELPFRRCHS
jgi:hypothetical protein